MVCRNLAIGATVALLGVFMGAGEIATADPSPAVRDIRFYLGIEPRSRARQDVTLEQARRMISDAYQKLKLASTNEDKDEATRELEQVLAIYFDKDMELREGTIADLRKRAADMERRLKRRSAARSEIIEVQLRMLVKEADGLGFFRDGGVDAEPELSDKLPKIR